MATKLAGYLFHSDDAYEAAKGILYNQMYSDCNNPDKIYFYDNYGSDHLIEIYSECSDTALAEEICNANGGESYSRYIARADL
jgi:hypothetical protein